MTKLAAKPAPPLAGPVARPTLGWSWIVLGWTSRVAGAGVAIFGLTHAWGDFYVFGVALAAFAVGYWMIRRGRRLIATRAERLLGQDQRRPVLYLRSFSDEDRDRGPAGALRSLNGRELASSTPAWGSREQDALSAVLGEVGPYVAIGKPREAVPELGAARMYLPDDEWQAKVQQLSGEARLVIVRVGQSEGLRWEIGELVRQDNPVKLLFLLPARPAHYAAFRDWADRVLPVPLPEVAPAGRLLMFGSDWRPTVLPRRATLKRSLAPFLEQNGIRIEETLLDAIAEHNGLRW
jgi:hypothetical protein